METNNQLSKEDFLDEIQTSYVDGRLDENAAAQSCLDLHNKKVKELSIALIGFVKNLEYMNGTKPQGDFSDYEIYNLYLQQSLNKTT